MGSINSYKDLLIWQRGIVLVVIYQLVTSFPQEELYALTSQIKRAAISIPSNISEGYGRNTDKSFSYFLDISRGSLNELETQLIIAKELDFVTDLKSYNEIMILIEEESKMINAFSRNLKN
ncbi:four helix bundle protein [Flavobacterium aciduliphilum]|uniref:Four helix bundle protein n=1 Tax=Flavobacterium aciduliphilum TaxID=1101402 RepID=A0A328YBE9_9FLAO|nr:four helix bundle protein [Flavobacterium aciduliphilum]RAR71298.1 four helix bundle protein [Flavobacterium aciduliphilum]